MAAPSPRSIGALIAGRYAILRKLGSGSMGTVYLARDTTLGRLVALKVIHTERRDQVLTARMQEEFRALASLRHPQIAEAYDFGYTENGVIPFYTREYVEGSPLPPGPPTRAREAPPRFLGPVLDLLDALQYVHERGILHLDIHAGNLIVAKDEKRGALLIDFGLVQPIGRSRLSGRSRIWSSMPPEMVADAAEVTPRTDVYLAGRLLQYRLTGRSEGPPVLPQEIPGWGMGRTLTVERIVAKAIQTFPEQRFPSAAEFRDALRDALGETSHRRPSLDTASPPDDVIMGRAEELARIETSLAQTAAGSSTVEWFVGRPGSGKTRLLAAARVAAQLRGLRTVEVRFLPDPGPEPVLTRTLSRASEPIGVSWLESLAPRHGGTPEERAKRAAEACVAEAGAPLILLLDDLDRADRESRILAEALVGECAWRQRERAPGRGVAILVTSEEPPPAWLARRCVSRLRPLRAGDARELLTRLLRPIAPPARIARLALSEARGLPLRLRRIATFLHEEWRKHGSLEHVVDLPRDRLGSAATAWEWQELREEERRVLEALSVLGRAASRDEISRALELSPAGAARALRRLSKLDAVIAHGRPRRFQLAVPVDSESVLAVPRTKAMSMLARVVAFLRERELTDPRDVESLARHLEALGKRRESRRVAVDAAHRLRQSGLFERAIRLLEDFAALETSGRGRLELVERLSSIVEETGDHARGIAALEPLQRDGWRGLTDREQVRARRRLGVHYHRAGFPERALSVFEEIVERSRDLEDLVFVDSELAEIHVIRGALDAAEEACRRGLQRIDGATLEARYRGRMDMMLRASLGHIELRRMRPRKARSQLQSALELSRSFGTTSERAAIVHNLAIAANQLNEFTEAQLLFRRAQRLLLKAGAGRDRVKIATNLAVLSAKLGDADEAREQSELASGLVRRYPGRSLEFFSDYSRGIVSLLLGEADAAAQAFENGLPRGRKVGDDYLVRFGEVYLAEAYIFCGRYRRAQKQLHATARHADRAGPPVLVRMVYSRLLLLGALTGQRRASLRARAKLESTQRTDVLLVEAWNDLLAGLAYLLSGEESDSFFEAAAREFRRLGIPFGLRYARLARLAASLVDGDADAIAGRLREIDEGNDTPHAFLSVGEALGRATAFFALGQTAAATDWVVRASAAIVGAPSQELDWMIELLRARLALRKGDGQEARRCVQRSLHARDLLVELVPDRARKNFLTHPRFRLLEETAERLERTPSLAYSTKALGLDRRFEGIIGQSSAMREVVQTIERISDLDVSVLITGETGTGKDTVANAIFRRSARRRGGFQTIHCASLPEELFESELFGHEKGAFTGAEADRAGLLENLRGGTVVFDEVGELSLPSQAKLLRVLESGVVRRLGGARPVALDLRFLFSTGADLEELVEAGAFRADLYFRIRGVEIHLPPLRERRIDIAPLAHHFLETHCRQLGRPTVELDEEALDLLESHEWPGNLRELESLILGALVSLSGPGPLRARDLEAAFARPVARRRDLLGRDLRDWRRDLDREYLEQLFFHVKGSVKAMTERLGIRRTTLYAWLRGAGLDLKALRRRLREG